MTQLTKKEFSKRKHQPDEGHYEGKHWCNCRTRNKRKWLGKKKYGKETFMQRCARAGLVGCFDGTGINSENYREF